MMGLTRKGEYAIRGMVYLARQEPGKLILVNEIAETVDVPQSFLAKIFQGLTRLGLVRSSRGAGGGFTLAKPAAEISLREVIEAVEGPICANRCVIDASFCDRNGNCTVHPVWHRVQDQVRSILDGVSLAELSQPLIRENSPC